MKTQVQHITNHQPNGKGNLQPMGRDFLSNGVIVWNIKNSAGTRFEDYSNKITGKYMC